MQKLVALYLFLHGIFLSVAPALADAVYLKDGRELKGIIVEDYNDRIVISTYEGEKTLFKDNISRMFYDLMEQNLVKLGDKHMSRRELSKAYFYYEKAYKLNPEHKEAFEKMNYVMGRLFREQQQAKQREIEKRREIKNWPKGISLPDKNSPNKLEKALGIRMAEEAGGIKIKEVLMNSPAFRAGLLANDTLVSVWGKLTSYMPKDEVEKILLEESLGEVKLSIKRNIVLNKKKRAYAGYQEIIGGKLDMFINGLTLVRIEKDMAGQRAGLAENDLIVTINGASTRYMPFKDAIEAIENKSNNTITLAVRRDVTVWRER